MGLDSMRVGGGRCPPLLVGGLLIACIMMVCNWWTLSSTNLELVRQIDELNEQIKISVEERDQCVTHSGTVKKQLKTCINNAGTVHVKLSQVEDAVSTCNEELESYKQFEITKTAKLEALKVDMKAIKLQLETKREENKKLANELNKVKDELEKLKLSLNAPFQRQTPLLPIAHILEKSQLDNKTLLGVTSNFQVNAPLNAKKAEPQGQDLTDKDISNNREDNAAEVHDNVNAIDSELKLNLVPDNKLNEIKKK